MTRNPNPAHDRTFREGASEDPDHQHVWADTQIIMADASPWVVPVKPAPGVDDDVFMPCDLCACGSYILRPERLAGNAIYVAYLEKSGFTVHPNA
jgi:hypothetical protein